MGITAISGPFVGYGITLSSTSGDGIGGRDMEYNDSRGPSLYDLYVGMMDPRQAYGYSPGSGVNQKVLGFYDGRGIVAFNPTAASSNLFVISSNTAPVAGGSITLLTSKAGVTATTIVAPETGTTTGTLLCLDSTATQLGFGDTGNVALWNPLAIGGRCLVISPSSNLDAGSFTVYGRDIYGYELTETFPAGSTTITGNKAFKYISAVTASTTITSTGIGVGTTDRWGMPFYVATANGNVTLQMSSGAGGGQILTSVVPTSGNFVFGSTAATQTSTMPDVRGIWISSMPSGSSNALFISVRPPVSALAATTSSNFTALFGATQFSST